jgi:hypothetical protein
MFRSAKNIQETKSETKSVDANERRNISAVVEMNDQILSGDAHAGEYRHANRPELDLTLKAIANFIYDPFSSESVNVPGAPGDVPNGRNEKQKSRARDFEPFSGEASV